MDRRSLLLTATLGALAVLCQPAEAAPPRIGTIADYPATGMMSGCANLYVTRTSDLEKSEPPYVFLCRAQGEGAWMNLDGRDTQLTLVKTTIWYKPDATPERSVYEYRAAETRIKVESRPIQRDDYQLAVRITAERDGERRVVEAVGHSDC